jgi:hypothetical protein
MSASHGNLVEVYLDLTRPPLRQSLEAGTRRVYRFDGVTDDIRLLRLDLTDASPAEVAVYSVTVLAGPRVLARYERPALAAWARQGLELHPEATDALRFTTTSNDPILWMDTDIPLADGALYRVWPRLDSDGIEVRLTILSMFLMMLAGAFYTRKWHLVASGILLMVIVPLVPVLARLPHPIESPRIGVSRATYFGLATPHLASTAALCVGLAVACILAFLAVGRSAPDAAPTVEPRLPSWRRHLLLSVSLAALFCLASPDLAALLQHLGSMQFPPHWDAELVHYWTYLAHNGFKPYADYWFPYGGTYVFSLPLPWGQVIRWLHDATLYGLFLLAVSNLGRRLTSGLVVTAVVLVSEHLGFLPHLSRYLLAANLSLTYALIPRGRLGGWKDRVPFCAAFAQALVIEPSQVVYGGAAVAAIFVLDLAESWVRRNTDITPLRRGLLDFSVPLGTVVAYSAWLAWNGQMRGFWDFYLRLADQAYGAMPADLQFVWLRPFGLHALVVAGPPVLAAIGLFERIASKNTRNGDAVLGLGMVSFVVLQKHLVRPMETQLFLFILLGVAVYIAQATRSRVESAVQGTVVGLVVAVIVAQPSSPHVWGTLLSAPQRTISNLALLSDLRQFDRTNADRFAEARFQYFPDELQLLRSLKELGAGGKAAPVFILTDSPVVYILTAQKPVWMANLYNASPIYEQRRLVDWLRREPEVRVAFRTDRLNWDGFQKVTRLPIVFGEVALNYVPETSAGVYDIARRRRADEPVALRFWKSKLGDEVNLGHIPRFADDTRSVCEGPSCTVRLKVMVPGTVPGNELAIPVRIGDEPFRIRFTVVPGHLEYQIPLNRMWFWQAGEQGGLTTWVADVGIAGAGIRRVRISREGQPLY